VFLAGKFLFVRSDTFAVWYVSFSHKTPEKKRVEEDASYFETDNQACMHW